MQKKIILSLILFSVCNISNAEVLNGQAVFNYDKNMDFKLENIQKTLPELNKKFIEVEYSIFSKPLDMISKEEYKVKKNTNKPIFYAPDSSIIPNNYEISFSTGKKKTNKDDGETIKLLVQKYPQNKDILFAYAIQLKNEAKIDKALDIVNKIIEEEPNHALAHFLKGDVLRQKEDFKEAVNEYIYTTQLNPYCADAYYNIAKILELLDNPDIALDYYKMAYQINPNDEEIKDIIMNNYIDL